MENGEMLENECVQRFSKADGESKSPLPQEKGFQILDVEKLEQSPSAKPDPSPRANCILRMSDQKQRHFPVNAINIDQEEEIWADLERRIHSPQS